MGVVALQQQLGDGPPQAGQAGCRHDHDEAHAGRRRSPQTPAAVRPMLMMPTTPARLQLGLCMQA